MTLLQFIKPLYNDAFMELFEGDTLLSVGYASDILEKRDDLLNYQVKSFEILFDLCTVKVEIYQ